MNQLTKLVPFDKMHSHFLTPTRWAKLNEIRPGIYTDDSEDRPDFLPGGPRYGLPDLKSNFWFLSDLIGSNFRTTVELRLKGNHLTGSI